MCIKPLSIILSTALLASVSFAAEGPFNVSGNNVASAGSPAIACTLVTGGTPSAARYIVVFAEASGNSDVAMEVILKGQSFIGNDDWGDRKTGIVSPNTVSNYLGRLPNKRTDSGADLLVYDQTGYTDICVKAYPKSGTDRINIQINDLTSFKGLTASVSAAPNTHIQSLGAGAARPESIE